MLAQGRVAKHEARQRLARELEARAAKRAAATVRSQPAVVTHDPARVLIAAVCRYPRAAAWHDMAQQLRQRFESNHVM